MQPDASDKPWSMLMCSSQKLLKSSGQLSYPHLLVVRDKQAPDEILDCSHLLQLSQSSQKESGSGEAPGQELWYFNFSKCEKDPNGRDTRLHVFTCRWHETQFFYWYNWVALTGMGAKSSVGLWYPRMRAVPACACTSFCLEHLEIHSREIIKYTQGKSLKGRKTLSTRTEESTDEVSK